MNNEGSSSTFNQVAILKARVFALTRACPAGRVTTYGWLAKCAGYPRGARIVGWIMNEASPGVPAQRVINSKGELSGSWAFGDPERMRSLLEDEGIIFTEDGRVNLKEYGWDPSRDLSAAEIETLFSQLNASDEQPGRRLMNLMENDPASPFKRNP